jgi:acid phosphatase
LLAPFAALPLLLGCGTPSSVGVGAQPERVTSRQAEPPAKRVTKLLVVVEENHSLAQMRAGMPYTFSLAQQYGYATRYHAVSHPSLPNYLVIAGGSTFGIRDDDPPSLHPLRGRSVFDQALANGKTAAVYAQSMPAPCTLTDSGPYAVRHNPWTYFADQRSACTAHDLPYADFAAAAANGTLPRAGMVVPDVLHDAHDGSLAAADGFFRSLMETVMAGPDWQSGHLAVVLTADEDDRSHHNQVLTVVIHPSQVHHVVTASLGHFALERLYAEVLKVRPLRGARSAPSMATAFGLPVPRP